MTFTEEKEALKLFPAVLFKPLTRVPILIVIPGFWPCSPSSRQYNTQREVSRAYCGSPR